MPKVTDVKRQKRSSDRFSVYVDGKYAFSLSDLDFSASNIRVGTELSAKELKDLQEEGGRLKLQAAAMRYLSYRMRSHKEMREYLVRKGWDEAVVVWEMDRLKAAGLIDDQQFAEAWVANRRAVKPQSRRRLEQELAAKGVDREVIASVLTEMVDEDHELAAVMEVVAKKRRLSQYESRDKLIAYLARQGYSFGLIKKAFERLDVGCSD